MDTHYTPKELADQLVESVDRCEIRLVADFTAGEGSLLDAASARWPDARFVATDIDHEAVRRLKSRAGQCTAGRCDFLSPRSRASCSATRSLAGTVDLVLLNPPFSVRGGTKIETRFGQRRLTSSPAMAFVLASLSYLATDGQARLIVPAGTLVSVRDESAWNAIHEKFSTRVLAHVGRGSFPSCACSSALIAVDPLKTEVPAAHIDPTPSAASAFSCTIEARLVRGGFQMHRPNGSRSGPAIVHSTHLQNGTVAIDGRHGEGAFATICRPAVLVPRVGRLTPHKVALFEGGTPVMLSDCVLAIVPEDPSCAAATRDRILSGFGGFEAAYSGTGAPHITLGRLADALGTVGIEVVDRA